MKTEHLPKMRYENYHNFSDVNEKMYIYLNRRSNEGPGILGHMSISTYYSSKVHGNSYCVFGGGISLVSYIMSCSNPTESLLIKFDEIEARQNYSSTSNIQSGRPCLNSTHHMKIAKIGLSRG